MRKLLLLVAVLSITTGVNFGCDKNKSDDNMSSSGEPMKMSTDDCAHCPGVQKASTNGTCPKCNMKVSG